MKRIYLFIIKSFIGPFVVTFTISMVFLIMQFLWKYVDDIMGKDVGFLVIFRLLFYTSANIIPMALPIAILFSSIMTMGNLAESNELTSMKSSGMSLFKIMRPMLIFVIALAGATFYFSNYVLPIANLKQRALIYDLQQKKPTLSIPEGTFYNDIKGVSIKVDSKDKETGELNGVLIYTGNPLKTIRAEKGDMISSANKQYLFLRLTNGAIYEESKLQFDKKVKYAYNKTLFKESIVKFDLSEFNLQESDENLYKRDFEMMSFIQLSTKLDTIEIENDSISDMFYENIKKEVFVFSDIMNTADSTDTTKVWNRLNLPLITMDGIKAMDKKVYKRALKLAQVNIRSRKDYANIYSRKMSSREELVDQYKTAWHQKFTLSFAIIVLFFVGAPLGAIVKKGGLGVPLIMATLLFLFYYILSIIGENLVESKVLTPFFGMWISSFFFVPAGLFLTYKAANESTLFDIDAYKKIIKKLKFKK